MAENRENLARERMAANPFTPVEGDTDQRLAHSMEYIAFYIGETEKHLAKIASAFDRSIFPRMGKK